MKRLLIIATTAVLAFVGCKDDKAAPRLEVGQSVYDLPENAATYTIELTSEESWAITGTESWTLFEATSGEGSANITFRITANENAGERSAELKIVTASGSADIAVRQSGSVDISDRFKCDAFRQFCFDNYDRNNDGVLMSYEVSGVIQMLVSGRQVTSLAGIEYFKSLSILDCSRNRLENFDISRLANLSVFSCSSNPAETTLDFSGNPLLTSVTARETDIPKFIVDNCPLLTTFICSDDIYVAELDFTGNPAINTVDCSGCKELLFIYIPEDLDMTGRNFIIPDGAYIVRNR